MIYLRAERIFYKKKCVHESIYFLDLTKKARYMIWQWNTVSWKLETTIRRDSRNNMIQRHRQLN